MLELALFRFHTLIFILLLQYRSALVYHEQAPTINNSSFYISILNMNAKSIYENNLPFPYIYIDNFFPEDLIKDVQSEFPRYLSGEDIPLKGWRKSQMNAQNRKLERASNIFNPPAISLLISHMQSSLFLHFLEELTGIKGLLPDPYLYGGGQHQTLSGGSLAVHLDYNYNENIKMWRRVNVFLYLNEDWDENWGGHLEFWDATMTRMEVQIAPLFNRLVVFTASEISWHGQPKELKCPPSVSRKSLALYYYTVQDGYNREKRATTFRPREGIDRWHYLEMYDPVPGESESFKF